MAARPPTEEQVIQTEAIPPLAPLEIRITKGNPDPEKEEVTAPTKEEEVITETVSPNLTAPVKPAVESNPILRQLPTVPTAPTAPVVTPPMANVNAAVQQVVQTANEVGDLARQNVNTVNSATNQIVQGVQKAGDYEQIISQTLLAGQLETQNQNIADTKALGRQENKISDFKKIDERQKELTRLNQEREDIMDEDIFGMPILDDIINTFRAVHVTAQAQTHRAAIDRIADRNIKINTALAGTIANNNAITKTINTASIEASSKLIGTNAMIKAQTARLEGVKLNADALNSVLAADKSILDAHMGVLEANNEALNRQLKRQALLQQQAEFEHTQEMWPIKKANLEAQTATNQLNAKFLNQTLEGRVGGEDAKNVLQVDQTQEWKEHKQLRQRQAQANVSATNLRIKAAQEDLRQSKETFDTRFASLKAAQKQAAVNFEQSVLNLGKDQANLAGDAEDKETARRTARANLERINLALEQELALNDTTLAMAQQRHDNAVIQGEAAAEALQQAKDLKPYTMAQLQEEQRKAEEQRLITQAYEADLTSKVQDAQASLGLEISDHGTIIANMSPQNRSSDAGAKYQTLYNIGNNAQHGINPASTWRNYQGLGVDITQIDTKASRFMIEVLNDQQAFLTTPDENGALPINPKNDFEEDQLFNKLAGERLARSKSIIIDGDIRNPLTAMPIDSVVKGSAVASTPWYQKAIKESGLVETTTEGIVNTTLAALSARLITPEEAVEGVTTFYKTAVSINSTNDGGLERIGLETPSSYIVANPRSATTGETITALGKFGFNLGANIVTTGAGTTNLLDTVVGGLHKGQVFLEKTDMTNPAAVKLMLTKMRADDLRIPAPKAEGE